MFGGKHFVENALAAISVGINNGIEVEKILEGIKNFELTKSRMEIIERKDKVRLINDSYNASYDSMKAAIEYLASQKTANKKITILGDMLELGEFSKELHEKVGEEVYKNNIDILITVGKDAKFIASKAIDKGMDNAKVFIYDTNEEAIKKSKEIIEKGDVILIKASNSMKFSEIVEALKDS